MQLIFSILELVHVVGTGLLYSYYLYKLIFNKLDQTETIRIGFLAIFWFLATKW